MKAIHDELVKDHPENFRDLCGVSAGIWAMYWEYLHSSDDDDIRDAFYIWHGVFMGTRYDDPEFHERRLLASIAGDLYEQSLKDEEQALPDNVVCLQ